MNELLYIFNEICNRRNVKFVRVESIGFPMRLAFGLPEGTQLLPSENNAFYFIKGMTIFNLTGLLTGVPLLEFSNLNPFGSIGVIQVSVGSLTAAAIKDYPASFECNSMVYRVNTNTSGVQVVLGNAFKIIFE